MTTTLGSVRRLLLTPELAEVTFARRGFPALATEATRRLEAIPESVICGFEWGIDSRTEWEVVRRLDLVDAELRGFAYEGATMAFTVRDAMAGGRGTRTAQLLRGPGRPHIFLAYIGIGFAMARLPRPLWRRVVPPLEGREYYPEMSWLAIDGYGFDRAYFETDTWVTAQRRPSPYPFQGHRDYFLRAVDQGIGRALWFIHGGQTADVADAAASFASERHGDLWSGIGLAATFAGGSDGESLRRLCEWAGSHAADLAQGAVFAAKGRAYSGHVPAHTELASSILAGLPVEAASRLADDAAPAGPASTHAPAYEVWRANVRSAVRSREARAR